MTLDLSSPSPNKTFEIGNKIGCCLRGNEIIFLCGELGAGKTLFTKGIAASLGINPHEIVSPTFTLLNQYEFFMKQANKRDSETVSWLIHFDCYRLANLVKDPDMVAASSRSGEKECQGLTSGLILPEIDEWIGLAIVVIEWAQYLHYSYFNLENSISIRFKSISNQHRFISIESKLNYVRI